MKRQLEERRADAFSLASKERNTPGSTKLHLEEKRAETFSFMPSKQTNYERTIDAEHKASLSHAKHDSMSRISGLNSPTKRRVSAMSTIFRRGSAKDMPADAPVWRVDSSKAASHGPRFNVEHALRNVQKTGWLLKKGGGTSAMGRRNWSDRFFVLADSVLTYYKSDMEYRANVGPIKHCVFNIAYCNVASAPEKDKASNERMVLQLYECGCVQDELRAFKIEPLDPHGGAKVMFVRATNEEQRSEWLQVSTQVIHLVKQ
jgi:hypothetical protein